MAASDSAGTAYSQLIQEQLEEERSRKASLEQRGITVITTSGILVSLLFGFSALVIGRPGFELDEIPKVLLVASLVAFFSAAIAGIVLNSPRRYREARIDDLRRLPVPAVWDASHSLGGRRAAQVRITILQAARDVNASKANWLIAAIASEVIAVALLAGGVILIILGS